MSEERSRWSFLSKLLSTVNKLVVGHLEDDESCSIDRIKMHTDCLRMIAIRNVDQEWPLMAFLTDQRACIIRKLDFSLWSTQYGKTVGRTGKGTVLTFNPQSCLEDAVRLQRYLEKSDSDPPIQSCSAQHLWRLLISASCTHCTLSILLN